MRKKSIYMAPRLDTMSMQVQNMITSSIKDSGGNSGAGMGSGNIPGTGRAPRRRDYGDFENDEYEFLEFAINADDNGDNSILW